MKASNILRDLTRITTILSKPTVRHEYNQEQQRGHYCGAQTCLRPHRVEQSWSWYFQVSVDLGPSVHPTKALGHVSVQFDRGVDNETPYQRPSNILQSDNKFLKENQLK